MSPPTRILVADDSPTFRELLRLALGAEGGFEIVGEAANGEDAVRLTGTLRPDVVVMDIRMPGLDGFEATRLIMETSPTPVVIVSATVEDAVQASLDALAVGALSLHPKPPGPAHPEHGPELRRLSRTIRAMAGVKVVRRWGPSRPAPPPVSVPAAAIGPTEVVGIAASTGGPGALRYLLGQLGPGFARPIVVVQHIAPGFEAGLAEWLDRNCALRVKVAEQGDPLVGGVVYVAPTSRHVTADPLRRIALWDRPPVGGFRPSATVMFESLARVYGAGALAVVMTGMGRDGVDGLRAIRQQGGRILVQDEATSIVYGMPGAAVAEGLADRILSLEALPGALVLAGTDEPPTHGES